MFRGASRADKGKQLELQNAILGSDGARAILEVVGESLEHFSAVNAVTALYRIARSLTSRAGRLRRKEASFVTADPRFLQLVEAVEERSAQLDRVGLENRKWAYHKLMLPSEYRARAALSVRLLDRAKDLQGELMDAVDVEQILLMVEDQCEIFNKVNVSTALHRVARLATTNMPGVAPVDAAAVMHDPRFAKLMTLVEETAEEMAVVSVSNVLWALARLHYPASPELVDILAARAARECASAEPRHLSTVMWALAVLGHEPRSRLLAAVADRAIETAEGFPRPGYREHHVVVREMASRRRRRRPRDGQGCGRPMHRRTSKPREFHTVSVRQLGVEPRHVGGSFTVSASARFDSRPRGEGTGEPRSHRAHPHPLGRGREGHEHGR